MSEDDKPRGKPTVKAKLPAAKNIKRPDFTPHGIGGQGRGAAGGARGPRPSALTAAKAKKRQRITILVVTVMVLAAGGGVTFYLTRPGPKIEVSGAFGKEPSVTIPKDLKPSKSLKSTDALKGTGPKVANGDTTFVKFAYYKFADRKKLAASYSQPQGRQIIPMTVGQSGVKGVDKGLVGHPAGSRVILQIPPGQGFPEQDNGGGSAAQQLGITKNDTLVFIMDVLATFPKNAAASGAEQKLDDKKLPKVTPPKSAGGAPKVEMPKTDPPSKLQVKTLIQGNGPALTKNDTAVLHYQGQIWKGGREFDSSWNPQAQGPGAPKPPAQPAPMPLNTQGGAKGFFNGLLNQKIGSRVLMVLPPSEGYGKAGNPQAGIKGSDTLVFTVDILGKLPAAS